MELVDRYLHAIEFWLPKAQKRDIIAELSEDVHSEIEEQQAKLGRPLNPGEMETILKRRGNPLVVANRYLPQRYLIGPLLFPVYLFVLKVVGLIYLVMIPGMTIAIDVRAAWRHMFSETLSNFWLSAFISFAVVTLVFAVIERLQPKSLYEFAPCSLPKVRNFLAISRTTAVSELATQLVVLIGWLVYAKGPAIGIGIGTLILSPIWSYFYVAFLALTIGNLALAAVKLMRHHWTTPMALSRLAIDTAGGGFFLCLLKTNVVSFGQSPGFTRQLHFFVDRAFPWAIVVCLVILAGNLYLLFKTIRPASQSSKIELLF